MRLLSRLVHGEYVTEARSGMSDYWSDTRFYALFLSLSPSLVSSVHRELIKVRKKRSIWRRIVLFEHCECLKKQRITERNRNVLVPSASLH